MLLAVGSDGMDRVRASVRRLGERLEASSSPVYFVNDEWAIEYCNRSCCEWLGAAPEQLLGHSCAFHSGEDLSQEWTTALCPPPQTLAGEPQLARIVWRSRDGQVAERWFHFLPLGGEGDCVGVLAVAIAEAAPTERGEPSVEDSSELHLELQRLARLYRGRYRLERLVGGSPAMRRVREQVQAAIRSRARVLVVGPEGSGREHVARAIHYGEGSEGDSTLVPLSCSLLDADLLRHSLRAQLAEHRRSGSQRGTTLLLLDVDLADAGGQAELREALLPAASVRAIATSARPLLALSDERAFDRELAHALSTIVIELPPLSQRREDIPYLAQQQLELWNATHERQMSGFAPEVLDRLATLPWPRNIDELAEVVAAACEAAAGVWIKELDLPERVRMLVSAAAHPVPAEERIDLDALLRDVERELVSRALQRAKGNKAQAARCLGIPRARLLRKLTQLGLDEQD
jgi:DNA-binding NtrC family response regulator